MMVSTVSWRLLVVVLFCYLSTQIQGQSAGGYIRIDERHAYSLSTFNPQGRLQQVDYAMEAAALGTPVLVLCRPQEGVLLMASPQVLPSMFVLDDGTARFLRVTPNLMVAHSGVSADGRVLCAAAQELAIQHEYVYDEEIPIDIFLEEVSLLYQEHTMKIAARPFGATMIVAYQEPAQNIANQEDSTATMLPHCFYRIDPSGAVECLGGNFGVINGGDKFQKDNQLWNDLKDISQSTEPLTMQQGRQKLVEVLLNALKRAADDKAVFTKDKNSKKADKGNIDNNNNKQSYVPASLKNVRRILTASLSHQEGMAMDRFELSRGEIVPPGDRPTT
ncbi:Proteasome subunit alpha type-2 [Seminavis robusta]|uniref:Proteasome subunit alpha type-2 n=1 Tax=Seminavis robusta TaxID=568900 RepID=A0A9N8HB49_9STRA|nr:Proteasome subunit alpha type-2 [Seminavis robusta]|eukprot:Sro323_g117200.1 Proteasome subunit alpha type-2 (333) ;mRNA; r:3101-4099